jgi:Methane oxygenase PmoA
MVPRGYLLVAAILALGIGSSAAGRDESWYLTGKGGDIDLGETPVVAEIQTSLPEGSYSLEAGTPRTAIAATVFRDGDRRWLATILPRVLANKPFSYSLKNQPAANSSDPQGIHLRPDGRNLLVTLDDKLLTAYRTDFRNKPIFFPIIGPTGESFTRAFPMEKVLGEDNDHPHQQSCWFTFGNVNGIDFWSEGEGTGKIRETDRKVVVEGPVLGRISTRNDWIAPGDRKFCEDRRTVTFYRTKGSRIIDFEIEVDATSGPVTFRDTKEGMFGLRVASSMDVKRKTGGRITNAEGLTDDKAWGQASPWVDYVGPVKGKTVGIAILNHPRSFRYPTTWHVRDYGLFAANPFGLHDFNKLSEKGDYTVPAGKSIRFGYRVILHEGDTSTNGLSGLFQAYAKPPAIEVRPVRVD